MKSAWVILIGVCLSTPALAQTSFQWWYKGGSFDTNGKGDWTESQGVPLKVVYTFSEVHKDADTVVLADAARGIVVYLTHGQADVYTTVCPAKSIDASCIWARSNTELVKHSLKIDGGWVWGHWKANDGHKAFRWTGGGWSEIQNGTVKFTFNEVKRDYKNDVVELFDPSRGYTIVLNRGIATVWSAGKQIGTINGTWSFGP